MNDEILSYAFSVSEKRQGLFAELSGDHNPMHVDAVFSRRLLFGRCVVHGMHLLLASIDKILLKKKNDTRLERLSCRFLKPTYPDEKINIEIQEKTNDTFLFTGKQGDITLYFGEVTLSDSPQKNINSYSEILDSNPQKEHSTELSPNDAHLFKEQMPLQFSRSTARVLFPIASQHLNPEDLASLLASTRTVGMKCPGLNSIFASININRREFLAVERPSNTASFESHNFDDRFGLTSLTLETMSLNGEIAALFRPQPMKQISFEKCRRLTRQNEFHHIRAIIIGGSRGLGEVTTKLLAAGGASLAITYRSGKSDALRIASEVAHDQAEILTTSLDVSARNYEALKHFKSFEPTHLFYFASPKIPSGTLKNFSSEKLNNLLKIYVDDFIRITNSTIPLGVHTIVYPSTSFIDELPEGFPEYILAKSCGETAVKLLMQSHQNVTFWAPRIPKLATDQTSEYNNEHLTRPETFILPMLRQCVSK